jgi:hypothetical protein
MIASHSWVPFVALLDDDAAAALDDAELLDDAAAADEDEPSVRIGHRAMMSFFSWMMPNFAAAIAASAPCAREERLGWGGKEEMIVSRSLFAAVQNAPSEHYGFSMPGGTPLTESSSHMAG